MPNENSNNSGWKNKLDDARGLEFFLLPDKQLSWERLSGRLGKKNKRKVLVWYWAAACFMVVCGLMLLMQPKNNQTGEEPLVVSRPAFIKSDDSPGIRHEDVAETTATFSNKPRIKDNQAKIDGLEKAFGAESRTDEEIIPEITKENVERSSDSLEKIAKQNPSIETVSMAEISPKKKLKVVHINELGEPTEQPRNFAHQDDEGSLRLKFINQNVYGSSTTVPNSISFYISRSKTVSPN